MQRQVDLELEQVPGQPGLHRNPVLKKAKLRPSPCYGSCHLSGGCSKQFLVLGMNRMERNRAR